MGLPEVDKKKGDREISWKTDVWNAPCLKNNMDLQILWDKWIPTKAKANRFTPKHIIIKQNAKEKK